MRQNAGLIGGDEFISDAPPEYRTPDEGGEEVREIKKREKNGEKDIDPRLAHDLRTKGGEGFCDADHTQCAANRPKEWRKDHQGGHMKSRARGKRQVESNREAEKQGEAVQEMSGESGRPQLRSVDASDAHLSTRKLEQAGKVGLDIRRSQTFGEEHDLAAGLFDFGGEGVVVTEGVLPYLQHFDLFKNRAADGGAPAPAEILLVGAKHGHHGSIPSGQKGGRETGVIWNEPAHGGGGANTGINQRSD